MKKIILISTLETDFIMLALVGIYDLEIMLTIVGLSLVAFFLFLTIASIVNAHEQLKEYRQAKKQKQKKLKKVLKNA
jgi:large-conductance mechanosensitive channel